MVTNYWAPLVYYHLYHNNVFRLGKQNINVYNEEDHCIKVEKRDKFVFWRECKKIERGNEVDYPFMANLSAHLFEYFLNNSFLLRTGILELFSTNPFITLHITPTDWEVQNL